MKHLSDGTQLCVDHWLLHIYDDHDRHLRTNQKGTKAARPSTGPPPENRQSSTSPEDLQLQIHGVNQQLRNRLDEQNKRMQQLQDQGEQLRRELLDSDLKGHPYNAAPAP